MKRTARNEVLKTLKASAEPMTSGQIVEETLKRFAYSTGNLRSTVGVLVHEGYIESTPGHRCPSCSASSMVYKISKKGEEKLRS